METFNIPSSTVTSPSPPKFVGFQPARDLPSNRDFSPARPVDGAGWITLGAGWVFGDCVTGAVDSVAGAAVEGVAAGSLCRQPTREMAQMAMTKVFIRVFAKGVAGCAIEGK